jgi:hypothetical protein
VWVSGVSHGVQCGDGEEVAVFDHPGGDMLGELHDLGAEVDEEGVAGPTADQHDGVDRYTSEVHCHGGSRAK